MVANNSAGTENYSLMGRRRFLKSMAQLGLTGAALRGMTQESLAEVTDVPDDEVPRLRAIKATNMDAVLNEGAAPEREYHYYTIPRDRWEVIDAAHDARRQVEQQLPSVALGSADAPVVLVEYRVSGKSRQPNILVEYPFTEAEEANNPGVLTSRLQLADRLPSKVTGLAGRGTKAEAKLENIPVRVVRSPTILQYYEGKYRSPGVPGGCGVRFYSSSGAATLGTTAYESTLGRVLVSSGHAAINNGTDVYQPHAANAYTTSDPNFIGEVNTNMMTKEYNFDACVIEPDSGIQTYQSFAENGDNNYSSRNIAGIVPRDRLEDMNNFGASLYKRGIATGQVSGQVTAYGGDRIHVGASNSSGDSGGPYYDIESSSEVLIAAIHKGRAPGGSQDSKGTVMKSIEDRYGISVP